MKKYILILSVLFITLFSFGQTNNDRQVPFHVADSTTNFNASLIKGYLVVDEGSKRVWILNERAIGSDNLSTVDKSLVAESGGGGGGGDLTTTLGIGNTTGPNDIRISDGQVIKSVNGDASLDFRANGNDDEVVMMADNSGFKIFGSLGVAAFGNNVDATNDLTSEINVSNFGTALFLGNKNVGIDKTGLVGLVYNQAFSWNFDPDKPNYPTQISTQKGDYKIGVTNSASLGGFHTIVKTDNTGYVNQLGFNSGGGFETILSEITPTADRQLYLPNINDTIAARSSLLENTDITLSGNRIITMSGNSFMFSGGETKIKGSGSDGTSEAFRVENLAGGNSSFVVDNEKHISQNSSNPISSTQYFLNSDGSEYGFRINGSHTIAGFSQTGGAPQGGYTCGGLLGGNTGVWVQGGGATSSNRIGGRFYVDGTNTADNTALTLRAGNGLVNRSIDSQMGDVVIQSGNVIIGANSGEATAIVDVTSTTQGFLPPRMTTGQRDAIVSPAFGLIITIQRKENYKV